MSVLLITYDLNHEVRRPRIVEAIKGQEGVKLSESSYAISTSSSPEQVYNWLRPMLDDNDHVYIVTLRKPWFGYGPQLTNEWLDRNLPN